MYVTGDDVNRFLDDQQVALLYDPKKERLKSQKVTTRQSFFIAMPDMHPPAIWQCKVEGLTASTWSDYPPEVARLLEEARERDEPPEYYVGWAWRGKQEQLCHLFPHSSKMCQVRVKTGQERQMRRVFNLDSAVPLPEEHEADWEHVKKKPASASSSSSSEC